MHGDQPPCMAVSGRACRAGRHLTMAWALCVVIVAVAASVAVRGAGAADVSLMRRSVLQAGPLPLPEDVTGVCTVDAAVRNMLETPGCIDAVTAGKATETCCSVLSKAVGKASKAKTANCLCARTPYEELLHRADEAGVQIQKFIDACNSEQEANIAYYEGEGVGPCAGVIHGTPKPLPLPEKPAETCNIDIVAAPFIETPNCFELSLKKNTSEQCCTAMANELGIAATAKTRNCLCVESVWDEIVEEADEHDVPFEDVLKICNTMYDSNIAYFEGDGVGKCFGKSQIAAPKPLPLPEKPATTCNIDTVAAPFLETPNCFELSLQKNTSEQCCTAMANELGIAATTKTRNCLCVKSVWDKVIEEADEHDVPFEEILNICNTMYDSNIAYFEGDGEGNCFGKGEIASNAAALAASEATVEEDDLNMRSFSDWMSNLPEEPAMFASFIFAFPSLFGVVLFFFTSSQALFF